MIGLAMLLAFAAVMLAYLAVVGMSERMTVQERLRSLPGALESDDTDDLLIRPLMERLVHPALRNMASLIRQISPGGVSENTRLKLDMAGHPWNIQTTEFLGLQGISAVLSAALTAAIYPIPGFANEYLVIAVAVAIPFGFLIPEAIIQRIISIRQAGIRKSLPDTIDLLIVSVEAGSGFDGALAKVIEKMKGPLSQEFERTLMEMRYGSLRRDALRDMARRTGVAEVSTFVAAINQADQLGVSIAKVLRVQGAEIRKVRSRKAREAGAKLPVKMMLPLVICIFPATLAIVAGPAVISIMKMFATWNVD